MFSKFMNKKFFHPGSYPNIKQKWIHEQRAAGRKKVQEELQELYRKEQDNYQSKKLACKTESEKLKVDLNFMYELPSYLRKDETEDKAEGDKEEEKFEWKKHAPRARYLRQLGIEVQNDQPFGVLVRNVRCFKCKKWGHTNTDRECPLFDSVIEAESKAVQSQADSLRFSDPLRLVAAMKKQHGLLLKKSVIGQEIDPMAENNCILDSDEESEDHPRSKVKTDLEDDDVAFVESLTNKQKRRLLKRLCKIERQQRRHDDIERQERRHDDQVVAGNRAKRLRERRRHRSEDGCKSDDEWCEAGVDSETNRTFVAGSKSVDEPERYRHANRHGHASRKRFGQCDGNAQSSSCDRRSDSVPDHVPSKLRRVEAEEHSDAKRTVSVARTRRERAGSRSSRGDSLSQDVIDEIAMCRRRADLRDTEDGRSASDRVAHEPDQHVATSYRRHIRKKVRR